MYYVLYIEPINDEERWVTVYGEDAMRQVVEDLVLGGCDPDEIHIFDSDDEID